MNSNVSDEWTTMYACFYDDVGGSCRSYGIFRLTDPGGITVLKECRESGGFHIHPETCPDGGPIYESCSNVYINPNLRFEVIDLRAAPSP